jgi:hypothetical protein
MGDVAAFLGIDVDTRPKLSPAELVKKIDMILAAAQRYVGQFPHDIANQDVRDRKRTHRELSFHVFRVVEALLDCADGRELSYEYYADNPPDQMKDFKEIIIYGEDVSQRLKSWWIKYPNRKCTNHVETYFGKKTLHEVMERTAWHAGQHVRQFMMLLEQIDIEPQFPLTSKDFAGLPMPEKVWDE